VNIFQPRESWTEITFPSKISKPEHVSKQLIRPSHHIVNYEVIQRMRAHITHVQ